MMKGMEFTSEQYAALGRIIVHFNTLERQVIEAASAVLRISPYLAHAAFGELMFSSKLKIFRNAALAAYAPIINDPDGKNPERRKYCEQACVEIERVYGVVQAASNSRNKVAHSNIEVSLFTGSVIGTKPKREPKGGVHFVSADFSSESIESMMVSINEAQRALTEVCARYFPHESM